MVDGKNVIGSTGRWLNEARSRAVIGEGMGETLGDTLELDDSLSLFGITEAGVDLFLEAETAESTLGGLSG